MDKIIAWNETKNVLLLDRYGISFEDVVVALEQGNLLADRPHPNQKQYAHQRQLIVQIDEYAFVVPYVENEDHYFLKTLFPSRQATRYYLR